MKSYRYIKTIKTISETNLMILIIAQEKQWNISIPSKGRMLIGSNETK